MKLILKSQILAIVFSLFWIIYLNVLAFFDQPERAMQHINWFVYGFAAIFGIVVMLLIKHFFGGKWIALPLIFIPEFVLYQPLLDRYFLSILSGGFRATWNFLSISAAMTYLIALLLGLILGIMFGRINSRGDK